MKHTPGAQILAAIADIFADRVVLSPTVTQRIIRRRLRGGGTDESLLARLSNRQLQVFELLGCGCQTREIAVQMFISAKTVETHIAAIKRRLGVTRLEELRTQAAVWVNA
jgi:DNA-binding NarL/FixJ family response regulator